MDQRQKYGDTCFRSAAQGSKKEQHSSESRPHQNYLMMNVLSKLICMQSNNYQWHTNALILYYLFSRRYNARVRLSINLFIEIMTNQGDPQSGLFPKGVDMFELVFLSHFMTKWVFLCSSKGKLPEFYQSSRCFCHQTIPGTLQGPSNTVRRFRDILYMK